MNEGRPRAIWQQDRTSEAIVISSAVVSTTATSQVASSSSPPAGGSSVVKGSYADENEGIDAKDLTMGGASADEAATTGAEIES